MFLFDKLDRLWSEFISCAFMHSLALRVGPDNLGSNSLQQLFFLGDPEASLKFLGVYI